MSDEKFGELWQQALSDQVSVVPVKQTFGDKIIGIISTQIDEQNRKGLKKYNVPLEDQNVGEYEWNEMAMEEMIDCMQYLLKENQRLRGIIRSLKGA